MNPLLIPTLLLFAVLAVAGFRVRRRFLWLPAILLAIPALLFAAYYRHLFDRAVWFYEFRSMPLTELTAAGSGLLVGLLFRVVSGVNSKPIRSGVVGLIAVITGLLLFVPYAKPIVAPLSVRREDSWKDGVCIQSTPSTCGPSSMATILNQFGIHATEDELARECYTYGAGTENWYMARAFRRRGIAADFVVESPQPASLRYPAVAGVQLGGEGGTGHFIAILGQAGSDYLVGDPMHGRMTLPLDKLKKRYYFTGFFLVTHRT